MEMSLFAVPFPVQKLSVKAEMQLCTWNIDRDQKICEYFGLTLPTEERGRGRWENLLPLQDQSRKANPNLEVYHIQLHLF